MKNILSLVSLAIAAASQPSINVLRVASAVKNGETITIGTTVFEAVTAGATVTDGRIAIDLTASSTAAASARVLTFASNPANNDTATIGTQVYTFKTALTASTTAGEVLIGADLTETRNNLVAAVNKAAGGGTTYGSATVLNTTVTATATSTNALTATAKIKGTAGDSIAIAESSSALSWASGATTLTGGADPSAAEAVDAFVAAMDTDRTTGFRGTKQATNEVLIISVDGKPKTVATTETLAGTNNGWAAATTYGGYLAEHVPLSIQRSRAATAVEVAVGALRFPLEFTPTVATATVRTAAGVAKAWDGAVSISGNIVSVDNSGSSDWAATDIITIIAGR